MNLAGHLDLARRHPLDFTIQYPPRREYFRDAFRADVDPGRLAEAGRVLLYLHVPFCEAKCFYCNFAVDTRREPSLHARYVEGLVRELDTLERVLDPDCRIPGIDIGGGTPTQLPAKDLARLLAALSPWRRRSDARYPLSVETTPRVASEEPAKLDVLAEGGVDRVSVGLQSTNDQTLEQVNRGAQRSMATRAVSALRGRFARVNADLIFALPGQTVACWEEDLRRAADLPLDSITTYDCLYRGKGRALTRMGPDRPAPETYGALYDLGYRILTDNGFHAPYGSVNFSRHPGETGTSAYFEGRLFDGLPYVGLGNYASSLLGEWWWFAPYGVNAWLLSVESGRSLPVGDSYRLPLAERVAKYVLLSLSFGLLDPARFRLAFGRGLEGVLPEPLALAVESGWLERGGDRYIVRPGGFGDMACLRSLFYTPEAIAWLRSQGE
ncbi:MAG: coproporphyrinogen-III oxidase family protein [Isosphaeraceae bacterium]